MISSIFGKTKPINYIIVLTFLFIFYWFVHFYLLDTDYLLEQLLSKTVVLTILLFSVFIANFIIKRNKMTGPNSFAMLFYVLLILVFPETLMDNNAILCSFFLLLGMRRLISIRSLKDIKHKLLDGTLWIMVSSLFYDWAVLYLLLVFVAIYIYEPKSIRNWLVPLVGVFAFFIIMYCLLILTKSETYFNEHYRFSFKFNESYFLDWANSAKLIIYVLITFLATIFSFLKLGKSGLGKIVTMRLIALCFILGLSMKLLISNDGTEPLIITFFPSVIFITNYVEAIKKPNIKEIILITTILIPVLVFISDVLIK